MSARISSATARQRCCFSPSPRMSASFAARSIATQHISFEDTYCRGAPRASQMPWSGSRQTRIAHSAWASTIGHSRRESRWLRSVCWRMQSSTAP